MNDIERIRGVYLGRNRSSAYKDLVWTVATATDVTKSFADQTRETLQTIDRSLRELGSSKNRIVSAQVYIAKIEEKPVMDEIWCEWLGTDPQDWPQRACLGIQLEGNVLIEVTVTAIRQR